MFVMIDEYKALVRRAFDTLWNEVNLAGVDEIFAADFVCQTPAIQWHGDREAIKRAAVNARAAFPDMQLGITDQIAEGDRVVSFYSGTGTHRGKWFGIAATGKLVNMSGIIVSRVTDGNVVEEWYYDDLYSLLKEMGALPKPG
jgi:steroid delta-isomerase-like uncharacterized protein